MTYKYIIMCGGNYANWSTPRQLIPVMGEPVVARTIRLLRDAGVEDISISTHDKRFEQFGVPLLEHENNFYAYHDEMDDQGCWVTAFYPTEEPACYLLGDVVFSPDAINRIVSKETTDIDFFASAPPFHLLYIKPYAEPFAFKVKDQKTFRNNIKQTIAYDKLGAFNRRPIAWEFWQVIKGTQLNQIDYTNYTVINDYTCDIDSEQDARMIESVLDLIEWR